MARAKGIKPMAQNKKAFHDYFVEERLECGMELKGTEVKSMRQGRMNLKESFAIVKDGEVLVCGMHISPYEQGNIFNTDPLRQKKLLLHKSEIRTLNALLLGENYARNLRVDIRTARTKIILLTALLAGTVTAYCGPVAFIGLAVPHIVRYLTGSADRRTLVPLTVIAGGGITLVCSLVAKQAVFGYMLPVNAVTSLIGAPIVIMAVLKNSSGRNR